ncbi:TonB-dependent receptor domain-containing protein [Brevundimonas sp.]|uniref:TonB-dependent receptor domain-containing protein n=1 Tax=Brevundimonas sp. TaxID=1871086 RepID=UPI003F705712
MLIKRKYLFGTTILAGVMAVAAPAFAQSQLPGVTVQGQSAQDATEIEEVVVTGTRIRRDPTNSPTPLIQVEREQLLETGQATVIDYLATIPALSNSQVPSDTTGSLNIAGLSLANLRTLGSGRTLTLVDGRRHVSSQSGTLAVDVDTIPRLLIENIEIVTGGASSVYGADAVAGVLNFVLRKDFEGLEIDARYREINQDGQANMNVAVLWGQNFLDDRLNVYAFAEHEDIDRIRPRDIDWLREASLLVGNDADPTSATSDGVLDSLLYSNLRTLSRMPWGVTVLANAQRPSPTSDPDIPTGACAARAGYGDGFGNVNFVAPSGNCFNLEPGKTYLYDGTTPRLANFGERVSLTGLNRTLNIGGDGINPNTEFTGDTATPKSVSSRFQTGLNFRLTDSINLFAEAKYVTEDSELITQPVFGDVIIRDGTEIVTRTGPGAPQIFRTVGANEAQPIFNNQTFITRLDNAFLPAALRTAIQNNTYIPYGNPTATAPGAPGAAVAAPFARHRFFSNDRKQFNTRELQRFVVGGNGDLGDFAFIRDLAWDMSYTYGKMENENREEGIDILRFGLAQDAVVDTTGAAGAVGAIVCRAKLLKAQGLAVTDYRPSAQNLTTLGYDRDLRTTDPTSIDNCTPLNVFGPGNQSQAALDYVYADITVREQNIQQNAVFSLAGRLWDVLGAGEMGVAVGGEWRKEEAEGIGRDADTRGRWLFLNTGADMAPVSYESKEFFAEVSLPLFRDSWLGEYAELSASYRYADYDLYGNADVYGVNLVYRPIPDITFKTSYNTSFRAPTLFEGFRGTAQTFANGYADPCDSRAISQDTDTARRARRLENCTALSVQRGTTQVNAQGQVISGLTFDYAYDDQTVPNGPVQRYRPADLAQYGSGSIAGFNAGNANLKPETSDSFTFTVGLQPRFIPNFALVLDYYEITIDDVIASVSAQTASNLCVYGPETGANSLNQQFCDSVTRSGSSFLVTSFVQQSFNYAKRTTRGLDFNASYSFDSEQLFGVNFGTFNYSLRGSWLIEQKNFNNISNPNDFTESASTVFYPRVRMTSQLAWAPTDALTVTWAVDWQSSQDITFLRDFVRNPDSSAYEYLTTGNFARHDIGVRYAVRDDLTLSAGVTNVFDAEQPAWLNAGALVSSFDPYGRRFNIGLNYRPW